MQKTHVGPLFKGGEKPCYNLCIKICGQAPDDALKDAEIISYIFSRDTTPKWGYRESVRIGNRINTREDV